MNKEDNSTLTGPQEGGVITDPNEQAPPVRRQAPLPPRPDRTGAIPGYIAAACLLALVIWSFLTLHFDFTHWQSGAVAGWHYIRAMFPRNAADRSEVKNYLPSVWQPFAETVQMAVVGTILGAVVAFPISFLAARTTSLFRPLSTAIKTLLNVGRAVPILVYALIVVSFIGLGPSAGVVAIGFGSFVMLSKLYAEALESVATGPIEAVRASGGNATQVFVFGMLPQVFPNYLSATLYAFELNLQASFVLGIVGAGGIGFELQNVLRLGQQLEAGVLILLLIILVNIVDYLSYRVRLLFS